ncbi:GNAT family protein [soil metagenome]
MAHTIWPLFDLRVRTARLELRPATDELLVAVADLAAAGVHDAATMPFLEAWTDAPPDELRRGTLQWGWRHRAGWAPEAWNLGLAVLLGGEVVGVQDIGAEQFAKLRTVHTGSWLGRCHQGQGIGTEMRGAVLHLAFAGLGATVAYSGAWHDNAPSIAVSRRHGYVDNGERVLLRRGVPDRQLDFRLERSAWEERRRDDVTIEGLGPCLPLFGADAT